MYCKNCGASLEDNAKFCISCGAKTDSKQQDTDEPILSCDGKNEKYRLYPDKLVVIKKAGTNEEKTTELPINDISACTYFSKGIQLNIKSTGKMEFYSEIDEKELYKWINEINRLISGDENFTPVTSEEIEQKIKKTNKIFSAVSTVIVAVIVFLIFGNGIGGSTIKISDDSVFSCDEFEIIDIKAEDHGEYVEFTGTIMATDDISYGYYIYIKGYDEYGNILGACKIEHSGNLKKGSKNQFEGTFELDPNVEYFEVDALFPAR